MGIAGSAAQTALRQARANCAEILIVRCDHGKIADTDTKDTVTPPHTPQTPPLAATVQARPSCWSVCVPGGAHAQLQLDCDWIITSSVRSGVSSRDPTEKVLKPSTNH